MARRSPRTPKPAGAPRIGSATKEPAHAPVSTDEDDEDDEDEDEESTSKVNGVTADDGDDDAEEDEDQDDEEDEDDDAAGVSAETHVVMIRDPELHPDGPHRADVHREEVANWQAAGWSIEDEE